jgi:hypothetical protein
MKETGPLRHARTLVENPSPVKRSAPAQYGTARVTCTGTPSRRVSARCAGGDRGIENRVIEKGDVFFRKKADAAMAVAAAL